MLTMIQRHQILKLRMCGQSVHAISKTLMIDRRKVRNFVEGYGRVQSCTFPNDTYNIEHVPTGTSSEASGAKVNRPAARTDDLSVTDDSALTYQEMTDDRLERCRAVIKDLERLDMPELTGKIEEYRQALTSRKGKISWPFMQDDE